MAAIDVWSTAVTFGSTGPNSVTSTRERARLAPRVRGAKTDPGRGTKTGPWSRYQKRTLVEVVAQAQAQVRLAQAQAQVLAQAQAQVLAQAQAQ